MARAVNDEMQAFPVPKMVKELQVFVGSLGYWRPFIPHLEYLLRPLYALVKKKSQWAWGEQQEAFLKAKMVVKRV